MSARSRQLVGGRFVAIQASKRPVAVVDHPHEAGLAVRQDQLGLGQPAALLEESAPPSRPAHRWMSWRRRCVIAGRFEAELKRLVPAQIGEAATGDEIGRRLDSGRVLAAGPGRE